MRAPARRVMHPKEDSAASGDDTCACGGHHEHAVVQDDEQPMDDIPIKAIDDIGRATAEDVKRGVASGH